MQQAIILICVFEEEQDYQRQLEELRDVAQRQQLQVITEVIYEAKLIQSIQQREGIRQLTELCRKEAIQKVLVSDFTHLCSNRLEFVQIVKELAELGTSIYMHNAGSLRNIGWESLEDGKLSSEMEAWLTILVELYNLDREAKGERIRDGIDEARRKGKSIGRPAGIKKERRQVMGRPVGIVEERTVFLAKYLAVSQQLQQGLSVRKTAILCKVAPNTVRKVKALL